METSNAPIDLWNVQEQRNRKNNAVESWNAKLNAQSSRNRLEVFAVVKILK